MARYSDLQVRRRSDQPRPQITITAAGIGAILVALPGVITLFKGEPMAEETFKYLKSATKTLVDNQHKQHDRLVRLETSAEAHEAYHRDQKDTVAQKLMLIMAASLAAKTSSQRTPASPVVSVKPLHSTTKRFVGPPPKCKRGYVSDEGKCVKVRAALANSEKREASLRKVAAQESVEKERLKRKMLWDKYQRQSAQRPASPTFPSKLAK
jgi:hypothetical protein